MRSSVLGCLASVVKAVLDQFLKWKQLENVLNRHEQTSRLMSRHGWFSVQPAEIIEQPEKKIVFCWPVV